MSSGQVAHDRQQAAFHGFEGGAVLAWGLGAGGGVDGVADVVAHYMPPVGLNTHLISPPRMQIHHQSSIEG